LLRRAIKLKDFAELNCMCRDVAIRHACIAQKECGLAAKGIYRKQRIDFLKNHMT